MRAALLEGSPSVRGLVITDVPIPEPAPNEVLVRVHAATVTAGDVVVRKMPRPVSRVLGVGRRTSLGHEFAGRIEETGSQVEGYAVGDRVFGTTSGLAGGAHADYVAVPGDGVLASIPDDVSYERAAPVPVGGMTADHFLKEGSLRGGSEVLIYGASGSVGTFGVQLAAHAGARVVGVCSIENAAMVRSLGASRVIDYTTQDFSTLPDRYGLVFDAVGKASQREGRRVLADGGSFVSVRRRAGEATEALQALAALLARNAIRAVIDRTYPLEGLAQAYAHVEQGHKRGNVLITVADP